MKRPAYQHYVGDWHADKELQGCSLAARGLWIEMLGLMHMGDPYGHLSVKGKELHKKDTLIGYLACWTGIERESVSAALSELEAAEVFSSTPEGIVFSRRMVRDEQVRQARANGGVKSLNNPNVPKRKGIHNGSPSDLQPKGLLSVEDEDEVEDSLESISPKSSDFTPLEAARGFLVKFRLNGEPLLRQVEQAVIQRSELRDVIPQEAADQLMSEYQSYLDSKPEFKRSVRTWLSECNQQVEAPKPKMVWAYKDTGEIVVPPRRGQQ